MSDNAGEGWPPPPAPFDDSGGTTPPGGHPAGVDDGTVDTTPKGAITGSVKLEENRIAAVKAAAESAEGARMASHADGGVPVDDEPNLDDVYGAFGATGGQADFTDSTGD
jgi:hypothetical protein